MSRTAGLSIDSLKRALAHGADPRYLALFVVGMVAPGIIAFAPSADFFGSLFDTSTRSTELVSSLDSSALTEVLRQFGEPGPGQAISWSLFAAAIVMALLAPLLAGAALVVARDGGAGSIRSLLVGAASLYARMFRVAVASALPLGIAAAGAAGAYHLANDAAERSVTEGSATSAGRAALFASIVLVWLASTLVESGRAHFAVDTERRSALLALWNGAKLFARKPLAVLTASFVPTILGLGVAAIVTAVRMRLPQAGPVSIGFAFLLTQLVVAAMAWGRSSRLGALVEVIRAERAASGAVAGVAVPSYVRAA